METSNIPDPSSRLIVTFDNKAPVELSDLTLSLFALSDEYKRFIARQGDSVLDQDVKLYVNQLRQGSIVVDLMSAAPAVAATGLLAIPYMSSFNTVLRFGEYVNKAYTYLLNRAAPPENALEKADLKNLSAFIEPIAKDPGSNVKIEVGGDNHAPIIILTSLEANAAQNQIKREIERIGQSASGLHENVLLYWHQTRSDAKSITGDKAIIEKIYPYPVRASFASPQLKQEMINSEYHPYRTAYVVDVDVQTIQNKPALYHIVRVREMFEKNEPESHPELSF